MARSVQFTPVMYESIKQLFEAVEWDKYAEKDLMDIGGKFFDTPAGMQLATALYKGMGRFDRAARSLGKSAIEFQNDFWKQFNDTLNKHAKALKDQSDIDRFKDNNYINTLYGAILYALGSEVALSISPDQMLSKKIGTKLGKLHYLIPEIGTKMKRDESRTNLSTLRHLTETVKRILEVSESDLVKSWEKYLEQDMQGVMKIILADADSRDMLKAMYRAKGDEEKAAALIGVPVYGLYPKFLTLWQDALKKYMAKLPKDPDFKRFTFADHWRIPMLALGMALGLSFWGAKDEPKVAELAKTLKKSMF